MMMMKKMYNVVINKAMNGGSMTGNRFGMTMMMMTILGMTIYK